jgi:hypothetical protein
VYADLYETQFRRQGAEAYGAEAYGLDVAAVTIP